MRNIRIKVLAWVLSLLIALTMIPNFSTIFAEDVETVKETSGTTVEQQADANANQDVAADQDVASNQGQTIDQSAEVKDTEVDATVGSETVAEPEESVSPEESGTGTGADTDKDTAGQKEDSKAADTGDKEDEQEQEAEEEYPAASFEKTVAGTMVKISAPKGALPEGADVAVKAVSRSAIKDSVDALMGDDTKVVKAIDITFHDKDGKEIEPKKNVSVKFVSDKFGDLDDPAVVHINDNGTAEKVSGNKVDAEGNRVTFTAKDFSVYIIVETGEDARMLVKFVKPDGTETGEEIASMYVKNEDEMKQVLYDPGVGELPSGVYFRGWTKNKDYTPSTTPLSIEGVRTEVSGMLPPESDETTVTYYAMLFKKYRITYLDENEISLGQEEAKFRADLTSAEQPYKVNMAYTVQDDTHHFEGWNVVEGGSNIIGHTDFAVPGSGRIYIYSDNK